MTPAHNELDAESRRRIRLPTATALLAAGLAVPLAVALLTIGCKAYSQARLLDEMSDRVEVKLVPAAPDWIRSRVPRNWLHGLDQIEMAGVTERFNDEDLARLRPALSRANTLWL